TFNEELHGLLSRPTDEVLDDLKVRGDDWYRVEMNYDPRVALGALKVPALFIFGDQDVITPVDLSIPVIRETLNAAGHTAFSIVTISGADHVLATPSSRGWPAPESLRAIDEWLRKTIGPL